MPGVGAHHPDTASSSTAVLAGGLYWPPAYAFSLDLDRCGSHAGPTPFPKTPGTPLPTSATVEGSVVRGGTPRLPWLAGRARRIRPSCDPPRLELSLAATDAGGPEICQRPQVCTFGLSVGNLRQPSRSSCASGSGSLAEIRCRHSPAAPIEPGQDLASHAVDAALNVRRQLLRDDLVDHANARPGRARQAGPPS